jgi:hypothetical protein
MNATAIAQINESAASAEPVRIATPRRTAIPDQDHPRGARRADPGDAKTPRSAGPSRGGAYGIRTALQMCCFEVLRYAPCGHSRAQSAGLTPPTLVGRLAHCGP